MLDLISEYMHYSIHLRLVNTSGASSRLIKYCIKIPDVQWDAILDHAASMLPGAKANKHIPAVFTQRAFGMASNFGRIQLNFAIIGIYVILCSFC